LASPLHNGLIAFQNFFDSIAKTKRKKKKNKFVTPGKGRIPQNKHTDANSCPKNVENSQKIMSQHILTKDIENFS
jgi:hypothetical protein